MSTLTPITREMKTALLAVAVICLAGSANAQSIDLSKPVYLAKDAVECGETTPLGAYIGGHREGGEAAGHAAVADLFVHPKGDCSRTIHRERVRIVDATVSDKSLVTVRCTTAEFGHICVVRPGDLSN
jgi:hypothetical protein